MVLIRGATHGNVLLLGMVNNAGAELDQSNGREYRETCNIRIIALLGHGYSPMTVDDKHSDTNLENHVNANFCSARRFQLKLIEKWGSLNTFCLGHVCLDYFFPPVSESFWC